MGSRHELLTSLRHPSTFLPSDLRTALRTGACLLLVPLVLGLVSLVVATLAFFRAPRRLIDPWYGAFARFAMLVGGTTLEVHGLEHVDASRPYVVVANHESDWDPIVIFAALRRLPMRVVVKDQITRIPVLGQALLLSGNVRVVRSDSAGDANRLRAGMADRDPDVSILFYAEGTRSRDGSLRAFKKGAFATALDGDLPVLPVGTAGTFTIWPPLTLRVRRGRAVVEIGRPVEVAGRDPQDRDGLRDECHEAVRHLRARARRRLRSAGGDPGGID
jgi:1-acyl-sn-glycerol-3-phosphate acyltransferase